MSDRPRFFRWYRTLPLLAMALVVALSLGLAHAPVHTLRRWLLPVEHREAILESSARHGVDPRLVCAVIKCESGWNASAVSAAGATGLMQLMPATSSELAALGLVDTGTYDPAALTDPPTNIEYGCAYLAQLEAHLGSTNEVIAAYNAGPGAVEQWISGGSDITDVIDFPETAVYLARVNEAYDQYQELYDEALNPR